MACGSNSARPAAGARGPAFLSAAAVLVPVALQRPGPSFFRPRVSPPQSPHTMKATWNGTVLAESDDTVIVEGNHYFPPEALKREALAPSAHRTTCPWKGEAHYYDVVAGGKTNANAAWYYPEPKDAAAEIKGRVAFWKGVEVGG